MEITDASLLKQIEEGKTYYFNLLYDRYNRLFYRWIYTRVGDKKVAEEIAQQFWIQIWKNPSYFKSNGKGCIKDYFLWILTFRILDYRKSAVADSCDESTLLAQAEKSLSYSYLLNDIPANDIYAMISETMENHPQLTEDVALLRLNEMYSEKQTASALNILPNMERTGLWNTLLVMRDRLLGLYPKGYQYYPLWFLCIFLFN